jgi:hypothetical protein
MGQDRWDRTVRTGQLGQNSQDRIAGTEQLGQSSWNSTAGTEQPGQDIQDMTDGEDYRDNTAWRGKRGQDGQNMIVRTDSQARATGTGQIVQLR